MKLLHYGLQRSGSNYLETLLKKNYSVRFLNNNRDRSSPLQKHFRLYDEKHIIPEPQYRNTIKIEDFSQFENLFKVKPDYYLVISKDPYSWYLSYQNYAHRCDWPAVNHHYIEEYNMFYQKFLEFSLQTDKLIFIRYIDLLKDSNSTLLSLEKKMGLKKRLFSRFVYRKANKVKVSSRFTDEKRAYYIEQKYLNEYSNKDLEILNSHLDLQVTTLLGYEKKLCRNSL